MARISALKQQIARLLLTIKCRLDRSIIKGIPGLRGWFVVSGVLVVTTLTLASIQSREESGLNRVSGMIVTPPGQGLAPARDDLRPLGGTASVNTMAAPVNGRTGATPNRQRSLTGTEIKIIVRSGDTLSRILQRQGVNSPALNQAIDNNQQARALYRLSPGEVINLRVDNNGELLGLMYPINSSETLQINREGKNYQVNLNRREFETRITYITGVIDRSLFVAGQQAGLPDAMIMRLVELFGWDIDFVLDIRKGDSFAVVYEERYWRGQKVANGNILAAEFINRGKPFRVIAHKNGSGFTAYYTPAGRSIKRTFLRAPVKLSRITSRFSLRRYHPILKRWRAHRGVDYGSPWGTPVRSTANGRVLFMGRKGGYGNTVILKHGGVYSTLYAHLSRFNRKIRTGSYVEQGQIIGYVGKTGLVTGPHLHYEFRVKNRHRNPLRYRFPQAAPINPLHRQAFLGQAQLWVQRLNTISQNRFQLARK